MDLGTSHESASNMPRSLWPAVPLWGIVFRGGGGGRVAHDEEEDGDDGGRWCEVEKRRERSACSSFSMRKERCVALCTGACKAGLKRANKKVVKASTGGGGCTDRGISYREEERVDRGRGLLPRAACLSSLFWCVSSLLLRLVASSSPLSVRTLFIFSSTPFDRYVFFSIVFVIDRKRWYH